MTRRWRSYPRRRDLYLRRYRHRPRPGPHSARRPEMTHRWHRSEGGLVGVCGKRSHSCRGASSPRRAHPTRQRPNRGRHRRRNRPRPTRRDRLQSAAAPSLDLQIVAPLRCQKDAPHAGLGCPQKPRPSGPGLGRRRYRSHPTQHHPPIRRADPAQNRPDFALG